MEAADAANTGMGVGMEAVIAAAVLFRITMMRIVRTKKIKIMKYGAVTTEKGKERARERGGEKVKGKETPMNMSIGA